MKNTFVPEVLRAAAEFVIVQLQITLVRADGMLVGPVSNAGRYDLKTSVAKKRKYIFFI